MALPAQRAPDIDDVRSDAANEMTAGNDLTALGYAGAPRTRARRHANGNANGNSTAVGAAVQGTAVSGGPTVWHPATTSGADALASTVFMGAGRAVAMSIRRP
ncbi:avirulence protein [Xanthomonas arboricola pv. juglandis]|uniref:Avirulence protein n=1 Tax=Xanthomonas euroxanthea TaxID=2259622 RepID=A0AA46CBZ8_9XANT|nr:avirulence protein [Xanthomonas euroxanthea]SYZ57555.1 avirulence protein [Xanthomonas arboricola pv. juglandis]